MIIGEQRLRHTTIEVGDHEIQLLTLRDTQQVGDTAAEAERLGIPRSHWALFGVVWDASRVLAEMMATYAVEGLRVLEVGSGIGLASLVLNQRGADITGTDRHPSAARFLRRNAALNGDEPIPFERTAWGDDDDALGRFDLIIGSDLLYERGQAPKLAGFIGRHARARCKVLIVDGGRGYLSKLSRAMTDQGFEKTRSEMRGTEAEDDVAPKRVVAWVR